MKAYKLQALTKKWQGKRVGVFSMADNSWHYGKLNYFTTNMFNEHGVLAYFGRSPVYDIDIDSVYEFKTSLDIFNHENSK